MSAHKPVIKQVPYFPEVKVCEEDGEPWPCRASRDLVICPKCGQEVGTEKVHGRARVVTTTVTHIAKGRVCHAILNTKETR